MGVRKSVEGVLRRHLGKSAPLPATNRSPASNVASTLDQARQIGFQRPLREIQITSPFGRRDGRPHEGIDFQAPEGTPFYAAADGIVVFAGSSINGYGNTVILLHAGRYSTLYAHASALIVQPGETILKGQALGYVGETGNATAPHLHFELRHELAPLNPAHYVPVIRNRYN